MPLPDIQPVIALLQALVLQGVPWSQAGLDPATGLSCYGVLVLAYAHAGISLPATAEEGQDQFVQVEPPYQPWDVMLARLGPEPTARHVGLFVAPTWGYHASWMCNGVARFALDSGPWRRLMRHGLRYKGFVACE
jgi:cell wall-associated NlpC family hydrolase